MSHVGIFEESKISGSAYARSRLQFNFVFWYLLLLHVYMFGCPLRDDIRYLFGVKNFVMGVGTFGDIIAALCYAAAVMFVFVAVINSFSDTNRKLQTDVVHLKENTVQCVVI